MPDFCRRERVLVLLGAAQLVVVLLAIAPGGGSRLGPAQILSASAFALWLALGVAWMLCAARSRLSGLPRTVGVATALTLAGGMAALAALIVYGLYEVVGTPLLGMGLWSFAGSSALTAVLITALLLRYFYVSDRWIAQLNANARAEADALQARIRPHFLFNSMNLIASLVRRDPDVAERAVLDLSDLFRAALGAGNENSDLQQEVDLVRHYLSIESLRLGDRLQIEWDLVEPLPWQLRMPRLALQPLVENAIVHGVSCLPEGGKVSIRLARDGAMLCMEIRNPAPSPDAPRQAVQAGAGHATRNIAYRLTYAFGTQARLTGEWEQGIYLCRVLVPLA
jgi:two-component system sensor histidine kinase AlgZ